MKRLLLIISALCSLTAVYADDKSIKVALLADLHISPNNDNDKIMPSLVEEINGNKYNLVVVAGDLTNIGSYDEWWQRL